MLKKTKENSAGSIDHFDSQRLANRFFNFCCFFPQAVSRMPVSWLDLLFVFFGFFFFHPGGCSSAFMYSGFIMFMPSETAVTCLEPARIIMS